MKKREMYSVYQGKLVSKEYDECTGEIKYKSNFRVIEEEGIKLLVPKECDVTPILERDVNSNSVIDNIGVSEDRKLRSFVGDREETNPLVKFLTIDASGLPDEETIKKKGLYHFTEIKKALVYGGIKIDKDIFKPVMQTASQKRQARVCLVSNVTFEEFIKDSLYNSPVLGKTTDIAKTMARVGLTGSSSLKVTEDGTSKGNLNFSFAVIDDFASNVKIKSRAYDVNTGTVDEIQDRKLNIEHTDGMGVIDIRLANKIAKVLKMKKTPSAFQIRYGVCKGLLVVMDIKRFTDNKVKESVLFPNSMWKLDIDLDMVINNEVEFCICNTTKPASVYSKLNYQFLLALTNLTGLKGEFKNQILQPIYDRLERLTHSENIDEIKSFLNLVNCASEDEEVKEGNEVSKLHAAISKCPNVVDTTYFQQRLRNLSEKLVSDMKQGKIPVEGSYTIMCADPTCIFANLKLNKAQEGYKFDLSGRYTDADGNVHYKYSRTEGEELIVLKEHTRVLKRNQFVYGLNTGTYLAMRAPLTHEAQAQKIKVKPLALDSFAYKCVFKYLDEVVVFNSYNATQVSMAGADFDGDACLLTKVEVLLKGHKVCEYAIYNKGTGKASIKAEFNEKNVLNYIYTGLTRDRIGIIINETTTIRDVLACSSEVQKEIFNTENEKVIDKKLAILGEDLIKLTTTSEMEIDKAKTGFEPPINEEWGLKGFVPNWKIGAESSDREGVVVYKSNSILGFIYEDVSKFEKSYLVNWKENFVPKKLMPLITEYCTVDLNHAVELTKSVKAIDTKYRTKIKELKEKETDSDILNEEAFGYMVDTINKELIALTEDRKTLAYVAYEITEKGKSESNSFPWVCCFDGLILLLDELGNKSKSNKTLVSLDIDEELESVVVEDKIFYDAEEDEEDRVKLGRVNVPNGVYECYYDKFIGRLYLKKDYVPSKSEVFDMKDFNVKVNFKYVDGMTGTKACELLKDATVTIASISINCEADKESYPAIMIGDDIIGYIQNSTKCITSTEALTVAQNYKFTFNGLVEDISSNTLQYVNKKGETVNRPALVLNFSVIEQRHIPSIEDEYNANEEYYGYSEYEDTDNGYYEEEIYSEEIYDEELCDEDMSFYDEDGGFEY